MVKLQSDVAVVLLLASLGSTAPGRLLLLMLLNVDVVVSTGWTKKNWDLKKYVYCSEGHKN